MNCNQAERDILLADSGELPARARARLKGHLAVCAACRAYASDLQAAMETARTAMKQPAPGVAALDRVLADTRTPAPVVRFRRARVRALAYAAAFLVVVLCTQDLLIPSRTGHGENGIGEVRTILAMMAEEEDLERIEATRDGSRRERIQALGREILRMEGLHVDETSALDLFASI